MRKHLKLLLTVLLVGVLMYGGDAGKCRAAEVSWSDDNGCTWEFNDATETLKVSGTGTVCKTSEWEKYCNQVKEIVIEEGITEIGDFAFSDCEEVTSIKLPDKLEIIGAGAFYWCVNLEKIEIPDTVTEIGNAAFINCNKATSIKWPSNLKTIELQAFLGCGSLEKIEIPDTVAEIGEGAFSGCKKVTSIKWPSNLKTIEADVFSGCESLEKIEIPDMVTEIGEGAFSGCKKVTSIKWPDNLKTIEARVFSGCENLEKIEIPNTVTKIGYEAFYDCKRLEKIEIPDTVTEIGQSAFSGCREVTSIKWPVNLKTIEARTFWGCESLEKIEIPDTVTQIGEYAFCDCRKVTSIKLPAELETIGQWAFSNCESLEKIDIPNTVTEIGEYAFFSCFKVTVLTLSERLEIIGDEAFEGHSASQIILPDLLKNIGKNAFYGCKDFIIGCRNEKQLTYCQKNNYIYVDMSKTKTPIDLKNNGKLTVVEKYYVYTGKEIKPEVQVTCRLPKGQAEQEDIILCEGRDYKVEYSDNTECGTATITVKGQGIYAGTLIDSFNIYKDITSYTVKLQYNEIVYDGSEKRPSITVSDDKGIALKEGTDYDVVYQNNIHPGQATVIITGKGIYKGTTTAAYIIRGISIEPAQVTLDETIFTYDGSEKKPHVTVTLQGKVLIENVDYVVSYQNNILVGTAYVVIQGTGFYEGGVQMSYNILPGGDGAPAVYDKDDTLISGDLIYTITDDEELEVEVAGVADKNLKQLVIPGTVDAEGKTYKVTSVGQKAFYRNNKLQSVVIGNNVASIEDYAFYGCKNVKSIKMGKSVEIIGASAFRKCTKLTSIVLPKSIDKLGKNAFYGCKKLKSITINANSVIDISANAVKGISKKAVIKVPKKLVKGYQKKLKGNTGYKKTMKIKKK